MEDRNISRREIITAAAALPLSGAVLADARAESIPDLCVELLREDQRRAAEQDGRQRPISFADDSWLAGPLDDLVATSAATARDFAAKMVAHAQLRGIRDDGECMSIVEASAIRDAHTLLDAPAA